MRISKKVREEAALLCALTASNPKPYPLYADSARWINASAEALALAYRAADRALYTRCADDSDNCSAIDAEAEALLRTGWTP